MIIVEILKNPFDFHDIDRVQSGGQDLHIFQARRLREVFLVTGDVDEWISMVKNGIFKKRCQDSPAREGLL